MHGKELISDFQYIEIILIWQTFIELNTHYSYNSLNGPLYQSVKFYHFSFWDIMKHPILSILSATTLAQSFMLSLIEIITVYHCWFSLLPSLTANMALNLSKIPLLKYVPGSPSTVLFTSNTPGVNSAWL